MPKFLVDIPDDADIAENEIRDMIEDVLTEHLPFLSDGAIDELDVRYANAD